MTEKCLSRQSVCARKPQELALLKSPCSRSTSPGSSSTASRLELSLETELELRQVTVRNTFIDGFAEPDANAFTLSDFHRPRQVSSCPAKHIGSISGSLEEFGKFEVVPDPTPPGFASLPSPLAFSYEGASALAPSLVIPCHVAGSVDLPAPDEATCCDSAQPARLSLSDLLFAPHAHRTEHFTPSFEDSGSQVVEPPSYDAPSLEEIHRSNRLRSSCFPQQVSAELRHMQSSQPISIEHLALPSLGSASHSSGDCKPCAFMYTKGCANGLQCSFCHLCGPEAKKQRRKEKREHFRLLRIQSQ